MRPKVYIETTIPSFYYNTRGDAKNLARQQWTRKWWDKHRYENELVTSSLVIEELSSGNHPSKGEKLRLLEGEVSILQTSASIDDIVKVYCDRKVMPRKPLADAYHLAFAAYNKCDILLTWNCVHLANIKKLPHLRHINVLLGLSTPI